jgi:hypothetical protein
MRGREKIQFSTCETPGSFKCLSYIPSMSGRKDEKADQEHNEKRDRVADDVRLALYVCAELDGLAVSNLFPDVHKRIQGSKQYRRRYTYLRRIEQAERANRI